MKLFILLFGLLGASVTLKGQNCTIYLVKDTKVLNKLIREQALTIEDSNSVVPLPSDPNIIGTSVGDDEFKFSAVSKNHLFIRFKDSNGTIITNQQANVMSVTLSDSQNPTTVVPSQKYILVELKVSLGDKPSNNKIISVTVNTTNSLGFVRHFKYLNGLEGYDFINNPIGAWFPTNMWSTSGKRSDNGVLFTAMPIGLALGVKSRTSEDFYWGGSVIMNLSISQTTDANNVSKALLTDFALGGIIDIGGWAMVGFAKPLNIKNSPEKLKGQFVLGIGSKVINFFTGK